VPITVETGEESRINAETTPYLTEIKLQIQDYIHQSIRHILQEYKNLLSHYAFDKNHG
jgi:hypothetical protein